MPCEFSEFIHSRSWHVLAASHHLGFSGSIFCLCPRSLSHCSGSLQAAPASALGTYRLQTTPASAFQVNSALARTDVNWYLRGRRLWGGSWGYVVMGIPMVKKKVGICGPCKPVLFEFLDFHGMVIYPLSSLELPFQALNNGHHKIVVSWRKITYLECDIQINLGWFWTSDPKKLEWERLESGDLHLLCIPHYSWCRPADSLNIIAVPPGSIPAGCISHKT